MFQKNLINVLISASAATVLSFVFARLLLVDSFYWPFFLAYFVIIHLIFNLIYAKRALLPDFTQLLFVGIVIKFLLALVIILIFSFRKAEFAAFSLHFISHYVLFTIFEIRYLLPLIKANHPNKINPK